MPDEIYQLAMGPLLAAMVTWVLLAAMLKHRGLPLDRPNERSLHTQPVPRIGGLAALPSIGLGWATIPAAVPAYIWAPAALLFAISLLDDIRDLPVPARLAAHLTAAASVSLVLVLPIAGWATMLVAVLVIAWMTNLYNFMDGSDGLAGGMALFGFLGYAAAAYMGNAHLLASACLCIAAASAAFLCFNFPPARVFLGDSGSIPLGFLSASIGVYGWIANYWPVWFPVLLFSAFIVDATTTLVRRALQREKIWRAHRQHYYQRLVRAGWGHRRTALAEYALMASCLLSGLFAINQPASTQILILTGLAAAYVALMAMVDRAWRRYQTEESVR